MNKLVAFALVLLGTALPITAQYQPQSSNYVVITTTPASMACRGW